MSLPAPSYPRTTKVTAEGRGTQPASTGRLVYSGGGPLIGTTLQSPGDGYDLYSPADGYTMLGAA